MATRLLSSLDRPKHTNRCLMSKRVYNEISNEKFKKICSPTNRIVKNMVPGDKIKCYEFPPTFYKNTDPNELREPRRKPIEKYITYNEPIKKEFEYVYATATASIEYDYINEKEFMNDKNQFTNIFVYNQAKEAIRCYLLERRKRCTLNWTIGMIKHTISWGLPKQQLQEILNKNEFNRYKSSERYKALIERCKEENLL